MRLWRRRERGAFRIEAHQREVLAYREGDHGILLEAAWGAKPPILYVPSARVWDDVVPEWLRGRREEVVARLAARSKHHVVASDDYEGGLTELRPVRSPEEAYAIAEAFLAMPPTRTTIERVDEVEASWRVAYRYLDPARDAPAIPGGRTTLLVRRDTGQIEILF